MPYLVFISTRLFGVAKKRKKDALKLMHFKRYDNFFGVDCTTIGMKGKLASHFDLWQ